MALLLSAPACVLASASSSVVIDDIRFVLIDLDLSDQIDPSITFGGGPFLSTGSNIAGSLAVDNQLINSYRLKNTSEPFASLSRTETSGSSMVYSSVERGDSDTGPHAMALGGQVFYTPGTSTYSADVGIRPNDFNGLTFSLSPKTMLLVSAHIAADIQVEVDDIAPRGSYHVAGATASLRLDSANATSDKYQSIQVSAGTSPYDGSYKDADAKSFVNTLGVELVNNSNTATTGEFTIGSHVFGSSGPTPIPEPSGLALALAGLLIAAGVLRRRSGTARALAATALALGASTPALAAISSSAALNNITFTLIDLAPDDGVDPWVTFIQEPGYSWMNMANVRVEQRDNQNFRQVLRRENDVDLGLDTQFDNTSAAVSGDTESAQASITQGPSPLSGHSYSASGSLSIQGEEFTEYQAEAISHPNRGLFQLSPHTALLVTADVALSTVMTPHPHPEDSPFYFLPSEATASYNMSIEGSFTGPDGLYGYQRSTSSRQISSSNPDPSLTFNELATVSFSNTLGTAWTGQLKLGVKALGNFVPAVIPEASQGAMALAGLAVVACAVRRRRRLIHLSLNGTA